MGNFETEVKTNSWEEFSKIASMYFIEPDRYDVSQGFNQEEMAYEMEFEDEERGRTIHIKYNGNPQDIFTEGYQNMQRFWQQSADFWSDILED